jgi:uncharacterized membrane protein YphA (DoxX/SURF4 family)
MGGFEALVDLVSAGGSFLGPSLAGSSIWLLAFVFCFAGIAKVRRPRLAARTLVEFRLVRHPYALLAGLVGAFESLIAIGLVTPASTRLAVLVAAPVLWVFTVLLAASVRRGDRFPCFCFGDAETPLSARSAWRTALLAVLASTLAVSIVVAHRPQATVLDEATRAMLAGGVLAMYALLSNIPRLAGLHRRFLIPEGTSL